MQIAAIREGIHGVGRSTDGRGVAARGWRGRSNPARRQAPVPTVPLIGRDEEVGALHAALDDALGGSGRVVLLGGEPGIGKSALSFKVTQPTAAVCP
jgi:predicted ATP-dependent serine protease